MQQFEFDKIPHIGEIHAVHGAYDLNAPIQKDTLTLTERQFKNNKVIFSLQKAIEQVGLKSGMTISFHHHFRNGDHVVNMVMDTIARMGIRDLTVAASSLTDIHSPLIKSIEYCKNIINIHI